MPTRELEIIVDLISVIVGAKNRFIVRLIGSLDPTFNTHAIPMSFSDSSSLLESLYALISGKISYVAEHSCYVYHVEENHQFSINSKDTAYDKCFTALFEEFYDNYYRQ